MLLKEIRKGGKYYKYKTKYDNLSIIKPKIIKLIYFKALRLKMSTKKFINTIFANSN